MRFDRTNPGNGDILARGSDLSRGPAALDQLVEPVCEFARFSATSGSMTPSLSIVSITLRVADLARSREFYERMVGFVVVREDPRGVELATSAGGSTILRLRADAAASPAPRDAAGLFHAALLFPGREALGRWLRWASERRLPFDGFSDHGVSEALYFPDTDGNGLEFYADRSPSEWPYRNGELAMTTQPLDVDALLAAGDVSPVPREASPLEGARWGHVHLRVTNLDQSEHFYRDTLGLSVTQGTYPGARFLAADGYHHHLGLNIWGQPKRPQPATALGVAEVTYARRGQASSVTAVDPDGMRLRVTPT